MKPLRPLHYIGIGLLSLLLGLGLAIRFTNRPIPYYYDGQPLFQAASKEEGLHRLKSLIHGTYDLSFRVSDTKTASLSFTDPLIIAEPRHTHLERILSLDPAYIEAVEELVRITDPDKNTAGIIRLDGTIVVSEPPTGDQINRAKLLQDTVHRIMTSDTQREIVLTYMPSDALQDRFLETVTTLTSLFTRPIPALQNNKPAPPVTPEEIARVLRIVWPSQNPITIDADAYTMSRFRPRKPGAFFDFSDPTTLRHDASALPLAPELFLEKIIAAQSTDNPLSVQIPQSSETLANVHLMSRFTTYHACCQDRVVNIQQMARLADGAIIAPGETFSLNGFIGERTEEKGFVPAGSILGGELVDAVGGGVSQFATNLYNTAFWSGLEIISHQPHSWEFARYPTGIEATISWPTPDLIFKNNTEEIIVLHTSFTDTSLTVELWGDNDGRILKGDHKNGVSNQTVLKEGRKEARIVSAYVTPPYQQLNNIPTYFYPNSNIEPGDLRVVRTGRPGKMVNVFRTIKEKEQEHTEVWQVTYRPTPNEIHLHPCDLSPEDRVHRFDKFDYSWVRCPVSEPRR